MNKSHASRSTGAICVSSPVRLLAHTHISEVNYISESSHSNQPSCVVFQQVQCFISIRWCFSDAKRDVCSVVWFTASSQFTNWSLLIARCAFWVGKCNSLGRLLIVNANICRHESDAILPTLTFWPWWSVVLWNFTNIIICNHLKIYLNFWERKRKKIWRKVTLKL